jgi:hypothetical protein
MDGDFHAKRGSFRIWNRLFARVRARKNEMIRRGVWECTVLCHSNTHTRVTSAYGVSSLDA